MRVYSSDTTKNGPVDPSLDESSSFVNDFLLYDGGGGVIVGY